MIDTKLLKKVWKAQKSGYYSLSTKDGDNWRDHFFDDIDEALQWLEEQPEGVDLYWCITPLKKKRRLKENIPATKYLWQDLDEVDPRKIPKELQPTISWESSPGNFHGLWKLKSFLPAPEAEKLNKQLAKEVGADKGSWILTKVLRIPGTYNYKYKKPPKVKLLWKDGPTYSIDELNERLGPDEEDDTDTAELKDDTLLKRRWNDIPKKVRELLMSEKAIQGKRSDFLWYMEHELAKAGFSVHEIYTLVKNSVWNKFSGRRDEEERLKEEIARAFEDEVLEGNQQQSEEVPFEVTLESDTALMSDLESYPGWLVEGFWTRRSHGIIAGEPKSFKSTLVLDLAVSVASGEPFMGEYEVIDPGPVLIIQNENANWIMKDRLSKIRANKGLVGEVNYEGGDNLAVKFAPELPLYYINQQGFTVSDPAHKKLLEEVLDEVQPNLIILDPLYLMFDGDVNSAQELNPVLSWLLMVKEKYSTNLILVHHWRKSQGNTSRGGQRMLGSTTLHGWVESAWYISVEDVQDNTDEVTILDEDEGEEREDPSAANTPAAKAQLTLEREFRGAGTHPKLDLTLTMGDFGTADYKVEAEVHKPREKQKGKKVDREEVVEQIIILLEQSTKPLSQRKIEQETGNSYRPVRDALAKLKEEGKVKQNKQGRWLIK